MPNPRIYHRPLWETTDGRAPFPRCTCGASFAVSGELSDHMKENPYSPAPPLLGNVNPVFEKGDPIEVAILTAAGMLVMHGSRHEHTIRPSGGGTWREEADKPAIEASELLMSIHGGNIETWRMFVAQMVEALATTTMAWKANENKLLAQMKTMESQCGRPD